MEEKYDIKDIIKIKPHPTEVITLFYDLKSVNYENIKYMAERIKEFFPDNKVLVLPNKVSLKSCNKDVLENIISTITEIIEEL